jgi:predicted ribosomally synthesized peptide with nif11-like leader
MSLESLEQFIQEVIEDQALQEQLMSVPDEEGIVSLAVQLGQEKGYSFTDEEVREKLAQIREEQRFRYPLSDIAAQPAYY